MAENVISVKKSSLFSFEQNELNDMRGKGKRGTKVNKWVKKREIEIERERLRLLRNE